MVLLVWSNLPDRILEKGSIPNSQLIILKLGDFNLGLQGDSEKRGDCLFQLKLMVQFYFLVEERWRDGTRC